MDKVIGMDLLSSARGLLERNEYRVSAYGDSTLDFEDDTLIGFCAIFTTAESLLQGWRKIEIGFLRRQAKPLRASGSKAWNVYSVFLTDDPVQTAISSKLIQIEENLESTRKIAQAGIATESDLSRALFPLISIQSVVSLRMDDPLERLRTRVSSSAASAIESNNSVADLLAAFLSLS
jgi:hypothetical protein